MIIVGAEVCRFSRQRSGLGTVVLLPGAEGSVLYKGKVHQQGGRKSLGQQGSGDPLLCSSTCLPMSQQSLLLLSAEPHADMRLLLRPLLCPKWLACYLLQVEIEAQNTGFCLGP